MRQTGLQARCDKSLWCGIGARLMPLESAANKVSPAMPGNRLPKSPSDVMGWDPQSSSGLGRKLAIPKKGLFCGHYAVSFSSEIMYSTFYGSPLTNMK